MARIFDDVQGLTVNTVNVGGATQITVSEDYIHKIDSREDAVQGTTVASQGGHMVDVDITSTDVLQLVALLTSTPGALVCKARESAAATYGLLEVCKVGDGVLVIGGGSFEASRDRYATISVNGKARFASASKTFKDVVRYTAAQAAPTIVQPSRLWKPTSMSHDPGGTPLAPKHLMSIRLDLPGRVLTDYGDADIGMTAVDFADFDIVTITATIRDATVASGANIATALMGNGIKDLAIGLEGVAEVPNKTLTIRNVAWRSNRRTGGKDWTGWELTGVAQWRDAVNPYTIRGLTDVTPANRLINFA